jgi:hypothetical protein
LSNASRQRWTTVWVGNKRFDVSMEWEGDICYVTAYFGRASLGVPVRCESLEGAKSVAAKRIKAYEDFLKLR